MQIEQKVFFFLKTDAVAKTDIRYFDLIVHYFKESLKFEFDNSE